MRAARSLVAAAGALAMAACAAPQPDQGFAEVRRIVSERTARQVVWSHGAGADTEIADRVAAILSRPLGPDDAVQVALFRNRALQARYAEIGLAQADLVQAGLLQNPSLGASIRFPDRLYPGTDVGLDLTQNLLNLIMLPARRDVARAQLGAAQTSAAAAVLDLVADVKQGYFRLSADQAIAAGLRERVAASDAAASLAGRMHDAGNISELDLARQQADAELTRTEYADALEAGVADREEMNRLMGLFGPEVAWTVPDTLPDLPPDRLPYDRLEAMAIAGNLRIAALRLQAEASAKALGIVRDYGWLADVQLGVSTEKNSEGYRVTGPTFQVPLPLFDRGQAQRLRAATTLQQDEDEMAEVAIETRAQVRAVRERLIRLRDLAGRYQAVIVPLQRRILALGVAQYNFMLLGPFDLLRARQDEIAASRRLIEARRDYWIARADLDRALGRTAPDGDPVSKGQAARGRAANRENPA
jgi:cobalt-zinc-cadmium efflux system outer membrane protein